MKTLPKSLAYFLLISAITICSSCKKDQYGPAISEDEQITSDTLSLPGDTTDNFSQEATSTSRSSANSSNSTKGSSGASAATSTKANASDAKNKDKDGKSLKGYGAPDGTDAENNDGDQYTKNDKTRMPSGGTSIK